VILDACRGVDLQPGDVDRAVDEMAQAGAGLIESADIVDQ
jgi:nicotinamidase/pyrazinamidase